MNEGHLTDLEITDYVDDPEGCASRAAIEAHLGECEACRRTVSVIQRTDAEIDAALMTGLIAATRKRVTPPQTLIALAQQMDAEEREAHEYLRGIVASPFAFKRAALAEKVELYTAGVVRVLCEAARKLREQNPEHALTVANEAAAIAEMLPADRYDALTRSELRADAQLERGNALRYLTRYEEALEALDAAQRGYEAGRLPERPLAMVDYVRSIVFMESERLDEAARLAAKSAAVFEVYGDRDRVVHAQMVVGGCLFYGRQYAAARDLYRALMPEARKLDEPVTEALCAMNLAHAEAELGDFAAALQHYSEAAAMYGQLEVRTELVRAQWGLSDVLVQLSNIAEGIDGLRRAAADMLVLGMTNDHAKVMLDLAGKLYALGELDELPALCADLVRVFTDAKMPENARTALAYLEAVVREGAVSLPLIDSVAEYIEREDYGTPYAPPSFA
jgi:tetratricopeptide (TPR) repeat protein